MKTNWYRLILFAGIFLLYFCFPWLSGTAVVLESYDYEPLVHSILEGRAFFAPNGRLLNDYPPLYPLFLAAQHVMADGLCLPLSVVLPFFTALVFAISGWILFETARGLFKGSLISSAVVAMAIGNPLLLKFTTVQYSEPLYLLFLMAGLYVLMRLLHQKNNAFLAIAFGLLLGFGLLTRPITLFFPIIAFALLLIWIPRRKAMLAFALTIITIVPWQLFTFQASGKFQLLSSRGMYGIRDGLSLNMPEKSFRAPFDFPQDVQEVLTNFQANYYDYQSTGQILSFLISELQTNPSGVIKLYLIKAARSWYGTDAHRIKTEQFLMVFMGLWLVLYVMAFVWIYRNRSTYKRLYQISLFLLWATLSIWVLNTAASSLGRYMVPMMAANALVLVPFIFQKRFKQLMKNEPS